MTLPAFYAPPHVTPDDPRLSAAAALRNRDPILAVLRRVLPARGTVLEVGSGTGEHITHFAAALPDLTFVPSDLMPEFRASIAAWTASAGLGNVRAPLTVDVFAEPWPITSADAVFAANMIHVAPPAALPALLRGAARILPAGGPLVLYGPFRVHGVHVAETNVEFDQRLRASDPSWGVRDIDDVAAAAPPAGLTLGEIVEMPANNRILVLRRNA